ncbi:MAG: glycosyltransferase [Phototrophicales bacterium]
MHILILASFYPSDIRPYTGIFFKEQVQALYKYNHQVGVIVPQRIRETLMTWKRNFPLLPKITTEMQDFPIYRIHHGWVPRVFPRVCAFFTRYYGLIAFQHYVKAYGYPDVIHAHNTFYAGFLAQVIREQYQIPTVLTEHSSNFLRGRIFLPGQYHVLNQTLKNTDRLLVVSHALYQKLEKYTDRIYLTNNVVDVEHFDFMPPPTSSPFVFASVGSLIKIKNYPLLIQAFYQLSQSNPNIRLYIGGEGPDKHKLQKLINHYQLGNSIRLLGRLSRTQVRDLFHQSHVIVSSSLTETFGVTLIEAMACGRPVIATKSGGPERFVTSQTGILVANQDVNALKNSMQNMMINYHKYDYKKIRQYCVENFSEKAVVSDLLGHYHNLIDDRR